MAGDWDDRAIGDIADVVGGSTPSTADASNFDGDIPWLTPKDLSVPHERYVSRGERNLSAKGLASCSAQLLPRNSVMLSSRAPIGYVAIAANPIATNQGFRSLVLKPGYDHEFVYYWLTANVQELERHASGSTFKELPGGTLKKIRIRLPSDFAEQRAIAHILGTLDDKIELNRRMNETLEAMARALFKSWFVDFDPVRAKAEGRNPGLARPVADLFPDRFEDSELGEIPAGWKIGTLADYASLNPETWSNETRPDVIEYVDLANTKWGRIESISRHTREDAPSRARRVLRPGDTIIGTVRPGNGSYAHVADAGLTGSTGFAVLRPLTAANEAFVYLASSAQENIDRLSHLADGAAYPAVRPDVVLATRVMKTSEAIIKSFAKATRPLLAKIAQNECQSRTLATLRDALLPKLISAELRIPDAERILRRQI